MKIALVVLLFAVVAQLPSCGSLTGGSDTVVGYVEEKYRLPLDDGAGVKPYVLIAGTDYEVPMDFYLVVRIGDLVKRENGVWKILKKAGT